MTSGAGSVFTPGTRVKVRSSTRGTAFRGRVGSITEPYSPIALGAMANFDWLVRLDVHKGNLNVGDIAFVESELEPLS